MGWGDECMVTGQARHLQQQRDPRKVRVVYEKPRWHEAWDHNPRIAQRGEQGDFQELRPRSGWKRPYIADKSEKRWTWQRWGAEWGGCAPRGEIYFTPPELAFGDRYAGRVVLEPHLKHGASQNKAWGWTRWQDAADRLRAAGLPVSQVGQPGVKPLAGVEFIATSSARLAAAVIARAQACVLPEGALHHIAAAVATPAVVIFGCYISPEVTGYDGQVAFFRGQGLGCGWRVPMKCCADAMASISPAEVADAVLGLMSPKAREEAGVPA